jgi:hypothetical protein
LPVWAGTHGQSPGQKWPGTFEAEIMLSKYYELGIQIDINLHKLKKMDPTILASQLLLETSDLLLERYKVSNQGIKEGGIHVFEYSPQS